MATATLPDDRLGPSGRPSADDAGPAAPPAHLRMAAWARSNRLFAAVLAVAALLRVLVMVAYAPALEFYGDSPAYLAASRHPFQPRQTSN